MKQGWEIKKIKDICEKASSNIAQNKITSLDGDYPVYGASGFVQNVDFYHRDTEYIGIVKDGSGVGRVNIYPAYSSLLGTLQYIIPKQGYSLNFVAYALKSLKLADFASGAAIPHIYFKDYGEVAISVPSLAEQERIVEVLDREFERIDGLKANAENNLQHAKDLFQAALRQELQPKDGWVKYKLQDVCTEYGDYGMSLPSKPYNGIRYLRITDITEWGELNNDFVSADTNEVEDRYMLRDGDVLFARTGATVGKTLVYNENMGTCSYAGYLIRYRLNQEIILPSIMYYITHSKWYYEWITANQKSATLPNISAKLYNSYEIDIPSTLLEQEQIVARLDILNERCKALEENYKKTIALCDDMKQALLRKAFNGEL